MAKLEDVDLHELDQSFGGETGQEEEGLIKKHCFEWTAVNRGMQLKQLKDKQARGLCIHSCIHSLRILGQGGYYAGGYICSYCAGDEEAHGRKVSDLDRIYCSASPLAQAGDASGIAVLSTLQ